MDKWDFIQTWAALEAGAAIGKQRLRAFYTEAARRGINVAARAASMADPYPETSMRDIWESGRVRQPVRSLGRRIAGTALRRSPYVAAGAALGGTLRDLEMEDAYDAIDKVLPTEAGRKKTKKKLSKFNKAVRAGMQALKRSKNYGKPGTINNGKAAFKQVTKVASRLNKGAKVGSKGVTGVIKRGIGRIFK